MLCAWAAVALGLAVVRCAGGTHDADRTAERPICVQRLRAAGLGSAPRGMDEAPYGDVHRLATAYDRRADRGREVVSDAVKCPARHRWTPPRLSLIGIYLGQAVVAILAVLTISNEYSTGMIRITFTAMPRRPAVLAAKAPSSAAWRSRPEPSPCSARCSSGGSSCPATASFTQAHNLLVWLATARRCAPPPARSSTLSDRAA